MTAQETSVENWFSTTLSGNIAAGDTTYPVVSLGSLSSPAYIVIDPESATKREVILCDGTWGGSSFVSSNTSKRGLAGSAAGAQAHSSGTVVVVTPLAQHIEDANDRIDALPTDADVATAVSDHEAAGDPHPGYLTPAEGNAAYLGIAAKAADSDLLDALDSTQFLRSDASDSFTSGTLTLDVGTTLDIDGTLAAAGATAVTVPAPTTDTHAATKKYVDDEVGAITNLDRVVVKQTDETISSDTTLSDDAELALSVVSGTTYYVDAVIHLNSGSIPDFKFKFNGVTVSASDAWYSDRTDPFDLSGVAFTTSFVTEQNLNTGSDVWLLIGGHFTPSSTGTLAFQWAQNTSDANNTTVYAGSYLRFIG